MLYAPRISLAVVTATIATFIAVMLSATPPIQPVTAPAAPARSLPTVSSLAASASRVGNEWDRACHLLLRKLREPGVTDGEKDAIIKALGELRHPDALPYLLDNLGFNYQKEWQEGDIIEKEPFTHLPDFPAFQALSLYSPQLLAPTLVDRYLSKPEGRYQIGILLRNEEAIPVVYYYIQGLMTAQPRSPERRAAAAELLAWMRVKLHILKLPYPPPWMAGDPALAPKP